MSLEASLREAREALAASRGASVVALSRPALLALLRALREECEEEKQ